jgi:integrase
MSSSIRQVWVTFQDGERFPMLIRRSNGIPLFYPTVYSISMRRSSGIASATIARDQRAIMHLYAWAESEDIDLEGRFAKCEFLSLQEIDNLTEASWHYYKDLSDGPAYAVVNKPRTSKKRTSLKLHPKKAKKPPKRVESATAGVRLLYIRDYLDWLAFVYLKGISRRSKDYSNLDASRHQMRQAIEARIPKIRSRNSLGKREGLDHETEAILIQAIAPQSSRNPWRDESIRYRNQLLIIMMLDLGIRRGEALGIRIEDIDFQKNQLLVRRAPDDKKDPRTYQPNAKTRDRYLSVRDNLAQLLHEYIVTYRLKAPTARKQSFLFVSAKGDPLSLASVTKIFGTLRDSIPQLPGNFSSHVLRHTWNDRFSEMMDKKNVPEPDEHKMRSYLMGWSETSGTAATYTKRFVREKAMEISIELQELLRIEDDAQ